MESLEVNNFYELYISCCLIGFGLYFVCEMLASFIHFFKDMVTISIKD